MQTNNYIKNFAPVIIGILVTLLFLFLIFYIFFNNENDSIKYLGAYTQNGEIVKVEDKINPTIIDNPASEVEYIPRMVVGGGNNWVIYVLETQPKIFTGKIIYENGLKNIDVILEENNFILYGEIKSKTGIENIRLELIGNKCIDAGKNEYEYGIKGTIGKTELIGCGGKAITVVTTE